MIDKIMKNYEDIEKFKGKSILVTGATGLIGSTIVRYLSTASKRKNLDIKVIAVARDIQKAKGFDFYNDVEWLIMDMTDEYKCESHVDYIIHTASPTSSSYFITNPVETINSTVTGLNNILRFASKKNIKGMVFTSSMEVYGICTEDKYLKEHEFYPIDCTNIRNSYAEGKKLLECLCISYGKEYNIPVRIVRLCQTFGAGVSPKDNRVFAQFARSVVSNEDIILSTKGETKRTYCSLADATVGILTVLLNGCDNEAYNIASSDSYYSIYEMAQKFVEGTNINILIHEKNNNMYLPTIKFGLDTTKIKEIGFKSMDTLDVMINELLDYFSVVEKNN